jgi:hypothetical protein
MTALKLFAGTAVWVPNAWKRRVTDGPHSQLDVVIVAASKAGAIELLTGIGEHDSAAQAIARACRWQRDHMSNPVRDLVDAKVVDMDQAGIYVWKRYAKDNPVARIDAPGMPIVGHFRIAKGERGSWSMYAEKVSA